MSASQEAYFVGRSELLTWLNSTLGLRLNKVEETANGAVACQLMDALYPGAVPLKKVDFNAKNDYDMINNYKVLQDVFNKLGLDKHLEVAKLIKGRPLDNTEFMQWFKAYWDTTTGGQAITEYDPVARRQLCKTGQPKGAGSTAAAPVRSAAVPAAPARTAAVPAPAAVRSTAGCTGAGALQRRIGGGASYATKGAAPPAAAPHATSSNKKLIASKNASARTSQTSDSDIIERLQEEISSWRVSAETATKEKDFYYSKLRAIELLCNTPGIAGIPVAKAVEDILYAATQEEGEASLAAAIAELEMKDNTDAGLLQHGDEETAAVEQLEGGLDDLQQGQYEQQGINAGGEYAEQQQMGGEVPVC